MNHRQRAKKYLEDLHLSVHGMLGPKERKQIDQFLHHLIEAVKKEIKAEKDSK